MDFYWWRLLDDLNGWRRYPGLHQNWSTNKSDNQSAEVRIHHGVKQRYCKSRSREWLDFVIQYSLKSFEGGGETTLLRILANPSVHAWLGLKKESYR